MAGKRKKLRIAVLAGGPSSERAISLRSAVEIVKALDREKYNIQQITAPRRASWFANGSLKKKIAGVDLVFIAMHGTYAEDGRLQSVLDILGIPYTGSGVVASAIGMDKSKSYEIAKMLKIITPKGFVLSGPAQRNDTAMTIAKEIGYPCVVKPNESGSSVGVSIVESPAKLRAAITKAFAEKGSVIVEEHIDGCEVSCAVLGNGDFAILQALPVVEILSSARFFDYYAKYESASTQEICPARLSKRVTKKIQDAARRMHAALGCAGVSRSDFIVLPSGKICFLEINTLPGMTARSLAPKEAVAAGMSFSEFLDKQIELALAKH